MANTHIDIASNGEIDQEYHYGEWLRSSRWRDRLAKKATHKALNIPEDDTDIRNTTQHFNGLGWKELIVLGAMMLGGFYLLQAARQPVEAPPVVAPQPSQQPPAAQGLVPIDIEVPWSTDLGAASEAEIEALLRQQLKTP